MDKALQKKIAEILTKAGMVKTFELPIEGFDQVLIAVKLLDPEEKTLIEERYLKHGDYVKNYEVCDLMGISNPKYQAIRYRAFRKIAYQIGLYKPEGERR
ncbi:hypothetical protein J31TS4_40630 [Paenibacillus sp. J31TS4]|uniref:hypothetical protein n=1 Tax=Paenibacillus sp. J31TS4 TaxID=2807195 RepID=UPI001B13E6BD|nr:hypothetical protein [Paenibacillus sp. J31TS4]GIP40783.1 hypothetical protein J31TS4_40630 [Paenibacillus sp. J31TS4]